MTHDRFVRLALAQTRTTVVTIPTVFTTGTTEGPCHCRDWPLGRIRAGPGSELRPPCWTADAQFHPDDHASDGPALSSDYQNPLIGGLTSAVDGFAQPTDIAGEGSAATEATATPPADQARTAHEVDDGRNDQNSDAAMNDGPQSEEPTGAQPVGSSSFWPVRSPVSADQLRTVIRKAVQKYPTSSCDSIVAVACAFGIDDLTDKDANAQLDYMKRNWDEVDPKEAQTLANHAGLVVAGKQGDCLTDPKGRLRTDENGNLIRAGGHVAVVVPGRLNGGRYPIVAGGAGVFVKDSKTGRITLVQSSASSTTGRSVREIWKTEASPVRYYTPAPAEAG